MKANELQENRATQSTPQPIQRLKACPCCGLIQRVEPHGEQFRSKCFRCGIVIDRGHGKDVSPQRTAAAAMGALLLFPAAIFLPILEIERLGYRHTSSVLGGIVELIHSGSWFIATVIFLFSIVLPIVKLVTLLELCWFRYLEHHHRAWAYRAIEFSGRWSMMDVMLLALLVMLVKLSGLVEFHIGPAVIAFSGCVVMSMIASMSFDPHSIWADE
ncbi:MAG: paraquat-inducible protein A [Pirellula sp.]|nr:paraquat-inducible protein A [Pirellula sp.]